MGLGFGFTGYESREELNRNHEPFARFEPVHVGAGVMMGLGEGSHSVAPKFGPLTMARDGGSLEARRVLAWTPHPSFAVTGSICTGAGWLAPDTVAQGIAKPPSGRPATFALEHLSGSLNVVIDDTTSKDGFVLRCADPLRTACKPFHGKISMPDGHALL